MNLQHIQRHGGVPVDVFEHVVESNAIAHVMDLERADWETRVDASFEAIDFDDDEQRALRCWIATSTMFKDNNDLKTFVEQQVSTYAKKAGVIRVYIDEFKTFTSPMGEPFARITVYRLDITTLV